MRFLRLIGNPMLTMYKVARLYIEKYEGFSYDFDKNGESVLIDKLKQFDFKTVFDVGANIGNYTIMLNKNFKQAKVHSFEISDDTFLNLKKVCSDNNIILNNFGLSDNVGEITYKDYGENSGVNTILENLDFHDHKTPFTMKKGILSTGEIYCKENNIVEIDFLKIDVEDAENLVLQGFNDLLASGKIKVIQFEYGYANGDSKYLMKDFYKFFKDRGYVIGPLKPTGVLFMDFSYRLNDFNSGPNFVAVHNSQKDIINAIQGKSIKGYI
ncbi:MAG: FkbM family methyltransferase [Candidatus Cloacimonadota bacterium]|nr:FkbM family methyltransferase [Candidatus Cloacimonadota bacterium]